MSASTMKELGSLLFAQEVNASTRSECEFGGDGGVPSASRRQTASFSCIIPTVGNRAATRSWVGRQIIQCFCPLQNQVLIEDIFQSNG